MEIHHARLLEELSRRYDVDLTEAQTPRSAGVRIAATVGALCPAAAVYLLFLRIGGFLSVAAQAIVLAAAPLLAMALMELARRRERTPYFTALLGFVAFACFVLDVSMMGSIFSIVPSPRAFLVWGLFGLALAYGYEVRALLAAGLAALVIWLVLEGVSWTGAEPGSGWSRPEPFALAGLACAAAGFARPLVRPEGFAPVYRFVGGLSVFVSLLVLANWGGGSLLASPSEAVEILDQCTSFAVAGLGVWLGLRARARELAMLSATFFVIDLVDKFFDWWWDWMPEYLFFLVLGATAVGLLWLSSRVRQTLGKAVAR